MARLTDRQKKRIIADRAEGLSFRQIAAKYGVSATAVRNIVIKDPASAQMFTDKKEKDIADIFAYMDAKKEMVCVLIDKYLCALTDDEKISGATVNQLSTALGTVIDKFTMNAQRAPNTALFEAIAREGAKLNDC